MADGFDDMEGEQEAVLVKDPYPDRDPRTKKGFCSVSKYRWSKFIELKQVRFKLPQNRGSSIYIKPELPNARDVDTFDQRQSFHDSMVIATYSLKDKTHCNGPFLNYLLEELQPSYAFLPFSNMGIDTVCFTTNLQMLFEWECSNVQTYRKCPISSEIIDILDILDEMNNFLPKESKDRHHHMLARIVRVYKGIFKAEQKRNYFDELTTLFRKENVSRNLSSFLLKELAGSIPTVMTTTDHYHESNLEEFQKHIFNMVGFVSKGKALNLRPFKLVPQTQSEGSYVIPDLQFSFHQIGLCGEVSDDVTDANRAVIPIYNNWVSVQLKSPKKSREDLMEGLSVSSYVSIDCELLWQVFLELLGSVLDADYDVTGKSTVVQPGLSMNNEKAQAIILFMDAKMYAHLKKMNGAKQTMSYLLNLSHAESSWCRLFIGEPEESIKDFTILIMELYSNFCGVY